MKDKERGKSACEAHAIYERSKETKEEREREREKQGGKTKRASESGSSRKTRLRPFRRVQRERQTSDVSVHARSEARGGQEGVGSCWAGCRERSHHPEEPGGGRAEKGRTRRCATSEGGGVERERRRGERRRGRGEGEKGGRKGTAPPGWRGGEREGGQTG